MVRLVAGARGSVVVTLDEAAWRREAAALEVAESRAARFVGDPADEAVVAAAEEMARELFGVPLEGENGQKT